jgi:hypothetical protein
MFTWFSNLGSMIGNGFNNLLELISKPLSYLFYFLDGIFYFFMKIFDVVIQVIMIFVALFQFIIAIMAGLIRTLQALLTPTFNSADANLPSNTAQGLKVVMDLLDPTGFNTVVPLILIALVWIGFIFKTLALFGGQMIVKGGDK